MNERVLDFDVSRREGASPRLFKECIGSCHAYLTLREDWRNHVRLVQAEIGFKRIRFHGIFHDLVGVYREEKGRAVYNFRNVDAIYDFCLSQGLEPFVELSFMPSLLASNSHVAFAYKASACPPADPEKWNGMVRAFVLHLIERYGLSRVLGWNFEVWNEPDLDYFWHASRPREEYFSFFAGTLSTIKSVDSRLKVGGPSTSKNLWVKEFLAHCRATGLAVDFISTHHYCVDASLGLDDKWQPARYRGQPAMKADVDRTLAAMKSEGAERLPLHYSEWNVSPMHRDIFGKDSEFTATFVLQTLKDLGNALSSYSYWCISDIFEESGPGEDVFSGKYGLVSLHGFRKPVFHAFALLNRLGPFLLATGDPSTLATVDSAGTVRILTWFHQEPVEVDLQGGEYRIESDTLFLKIRLLLPSGSYRLRTFRVDSNHSNSFRSWRMMGSPEDPDAEEIRIIQEDSLLHEEPVRLLTVEGEGRWEDDLEQNGILFYELERLF